MPVPKSMIAVFAASLTAASVAAVSSIGDRSTPAAIALTAAEDDGRREDGDDGLEVVDESGDDASGDGTTRGDVSDDGEVRRARNRVDAPAISPADDSVHSRDGSASGGSTGPAAAPDDSIDASVSVASADDSAETPAVRAAAVDDSADSVDTAAPAAPRDDPPPPPPGDDSVDSVDTAVQPAPHTDPPAPGADAPAPADASVDGDSGGDADDSGSDDGRGDSGGDDT